jgi:hypothetical protein
VNAASPILAPADDLDFKVECWAQRVIARSVLFLDGELDLHTAVDGAWAAAERDGLIDVFGADEIQAAMGLAFWGSR